MPSDPQPQMLPLDHAAARRPCRHAVVSARSLHSDDLDNLDLALRLADRVSLSVEDDGIPPERIEEFVRRTGESARVDILGPSGDDVLQSHTVDLVVTDQGYFGFFDERNMRRHSNRLEEYNILISPPARHQPRPTLPKDCPPFRLASVGGTFNTFHLGHENYLRFALELAASIHIFIADNTYATPRKNYDPKRLSDRSRAVRQFLKDIGAGERFEIEPLRDVSDIQEYVGGKEDLDLVLAERAYVPWFVKWNEERMHRELEGYTIMCRPRATTVDGKEIASSQWESGPRTRKRPEIGNLFDSGGG